jgi:hypothetical protein
MAGLVPRLLPWLAILTLLALKPNRGWSAWSVWLPLACLAAGCHCLQLTSQDSPNSLAANASELLLNVPLALAFALAALWLVAPYVGGQHRLRTLFGSVGILAIVILFSFAATVGWGVGVEPLASLLDPRHCAATANVGLLALPFLIPLVVPAPGVAAAMALCGLASRGRYRPFALYLWLFISLLMVWVAASSLAYIVWHAASPRGAEYTLFLGIGLLMVVVSFATLLPFLVLSSFSPFFRERLKALLHLKSEEPPVIQSGCVTPCAP